MCEITRNNYKIIEKMLNQKLAEKGYDKTIFTRDGWILCDNVSIDVTTDSIQINCFLKIGNKNIGTGAIISIDDEIIVVNDSGTIDIEVFDADVQKGSMRL
jgi:hypothetical protein